MMNNKLVVPLISTIYSPVNFIINLNNLVVLSNICLAILCNECSIVPLLQSIQLKREPTPKLSYTKKDLDIYNLPLAKPPKRDLQSKHFSLTPFSLTYHSDTIINSTLVRTPPLYILPLGDSITQGSRIPGGYRRKLYYYLLKHHYNPYYLGTKSTNCWWKTLGSQRCSDAQKYHEGHGKRNIRYFISHLPLWKSYYPFSPDVVLIHVGTVEFAWKNTYATMKAAISHYDSLIATVYRLFPHTHIIISTLISRKSYKFNRRMKGLFNPYIPTLMHKYHTQGFSISMIDFAKLIPSKILLQDGVHPNQSGYNVMGRAWAKEIRKIFGKNGHKWKGPGIVDINVNGINLKVTMSKPLKKWSVQDLAKYNLLEDFPNINRTTIIGVKLDKNMRTIVMTLSKQLDENFNYVLSISDIMDMTIYENTYSGAIQISFGMVTTTASNSTTLVRQFSHLSSRDESGFWLNHMEIGETCES